VNAERHQQEQREAAALAAVQERRNRPLGLLLVSAGALVVMAVFAAVSLAGVRGAKAAFDARRSQSDEILQVASQIEQVRSAASAGPSTTRFARERNPLNKFAQVSGQVGLDPAPTPVPQGDLRLDADSPLLLKSWSVSLRGVTPDEGLRWIDLAADAMPGLHVRDLQLSTNAAGWNFEMTLARWELSQ
jgi:type II secretory pathway pseudopilin PulG